MEPASENKFLTIAIPTWNRAKYLNDLLEQLTFQILTFRYEEEVELLISNNNSEDRTEEIVKQFKEKFSFITYNRNQTNIGAKSNVIKAMELSNAEYVMVIGDDDRMRDNSIADIISVLKSRRNLGVLVDQTGFRKKAFPAGSEITLEQLVRNYYWIIGNAGHYIMKTDYVKKYVSQLGYNFFNECWPHTQLIILGVQNSGDECFVDELNLLQTGLHGEVMVYTSFYLWRTCYYELLVAANDLRDKVSPEIYSAARSYMKNNLGQQLFNILQCGIFVDENQTRKKTTNHILINLHLFSTYEKIFLMVIVIALSIPVFISRPLADVFIFFLKGKSGIKKKNDFVKNEFLKKSKQFENKDSIRELEFEK